MITTPHVAKLLSEGIAAQTEIDNLGDAASVVLVEISPVLDLFQLAEFVLAGLGEPGPADPDLVEAYENWKSHGIGEVEREAAPANNPIQGIVG